MTEEEEEKGKRFRVIVSMEYEIKAETPEEAEEEAVALFEDDMNKAMSEGESLADWGSIEVKELCNSTWTTADTVYRCSLTIDEHEEDITGQRLHRSEGGFEWYE
jgi:hypothetical protein